MQDFAIRSDTKLINLLGRTWTKLSFNKITVMLTV